MDPSDPNAAPGWRYHPTLPNSPGGWTCNGCGARSSVRPTEKRRGRHVLSERHLRYAVMEAALQEGLVPLHGPALARARRHLTGQPTQFVIQLRGAVKIGANPYPISWILAEEAEQLLDDTPVTAKITRRYLRDVLRARQRFLGGEMWWLVAARLLGTNAWLDSQWGRAVYDTQ